MFPLRCFRFDYLTLISISIFGNGIHKIKFGKDLVDIHTNHNSKKMTIVNQFLGTEYCYTNKINDSLDLITEMGTYGAFLLSELAGQTSHFEQKMQ